MEQRKAHVQKLTSGRLLAKNVLYNLVGQFLPFFIYLIIIPQLVQRLGTDRFGIITIFWMIVGYLSFFDLGIGRVLTQFVSEKLGKNAKQDIPQIVSTGLVVMFVLGIVFAVILLLIAFPLAYKILNIPTNLQHDTFHAFLVIAFSTPFVTVASGARGVLEAHQQFGKVNIVRTVNGSFTFLAPFIAILIKSNLIAIAFSLFFLRAIIAVLYFLMLLNTAGIFLNRKSFDIKLVPAMIKMGGWMSVSNITGPVLMFVDRFFIATFLTVSAVAFYATPFDVVTKLLVVTSAFIRVLFPAFSASYAIDKERALFLFSRAIRVLFIVLFPFTFLFAVGGFKILEMWVGHEFAVNGSLVLKWLALGVLFNAPGQVAFVYLQAIGRSDLTAKIHLAQIPFYALLLYLLMKNFGINGIAIAWMVRVLAESIILVLLCKIEDFKPLKNALIFYAGAGFVLPLFYYHFFQKPLIPAMIVFCSFFVFSYLFLLIGSEKQFLQQKFLRKR